MKQFRMVWIIAAALTAAIALLFWMGPYPLRDATLSLSLGSKSRRMVEAMGVPDGAYNVSKISVSGPDGPMPEMATRSFEARDSAAALGQFFSAKCKEAGLRLPDAEDLRLEPDLLCRARVPGGVESVHVSTKCTSDACLATVEARSLTH